jgi:predicted subunit of tRNA(5-methylaminomethyl-2-thiouridylate) methyltransferase
MEFDFQEFCLGLNGLTEEEVSDKILKKIEKLADERYSQRLSESEEILCQDWRTELRALYRKTNLNSKKLFQLNTVLKRN